MYDIVCNNKNDSINFFNMTYISTTEIIEDFSSSYILEITNNNTKNKYMIVTKNDIQYFMSVEGKEV